MAPKRYRLSFKRTLKCWLVRPVTDEDGHEVVPRAAAAYHRVTISPNAHAFTVSQLDAEASPTSNLPVEKGWLIIVGHLEHHIDEDGIETAAFT